MFRVGDLVKIIGNSSSCEHYYPIGGICRIKSERGCSSSTVKVTPYSFSGSYSDQYIEVIDLQLHLGNKIPKESIFKETGITKWLEAH